MTLAEKAVEIICSQDGVVEHPLGSNRGPEVDRYLRAVGLDPGHAAYAWCAALVSWGVVEAAKAVGGPPRFHTGPGALNLLRLNAALQIEDPEPNCVFVIDHGGGQGHAGVVLRVDAQDPELLDTFEGNTDASGSRTGGQAMFRTRRRDEVAGYVRIA